MTRTLKLYDFEDFKTGDQIVVDIDTSALTWRNTSESNVELAIAGGPIDKILTNTNCYTPEGKALFVLTDLNLGAAGNTGQVDWVGLPPDRKAGVYETL